MDNLKNIIEAILFVSGDGVAISDISEKLNIDIEDVEKIVLELQAEKKNNKSGIQVILFNGNAQLCSNTDYSEQIADVLNPIREKNLTRAVLEVCTIIAYKQPITRLEIENIRGVNSDYAVGSLLDNQLIEVIGRKDAIGKPLLFGTTDKFLKKFGLNSLDDLPDYDDLLGRIKVLHDPANNKMFNYDDIENQEPEKVEINVNIDNVNIVADAGDIGLDEAEEEILKSMLQENANDKIIGKDDLSDIFDELDFGLDKKTNEKDIV